jgi:hypothetical protein
MKRALLTAICLLFAFMAIDGCNEKPKDQVPTTIQPTPKEQPTEGSFGGLKK